MSYMRLHVLTWLCCAALSAKSQGVYLPAHHYSTHVLDRMEIKQGRLATPHEFNLTNRYFRRDAVARYVDSFDMTTARLTPADYFNLLYLQSDNFEWTNSQNTRSKRRSRMGVYAYKSAFYAVNTPDFKLSVNPVTHQFAATETNKDGIVSFNTRGIEMRAAIGHNIGVYTRMEDDLYKPHSWASDYFLTNRVLPGEGFLKTEDSVTFNYWRARGYVSFNVNKHIDMQFGHDNNFIGNGYRTLYMSDFSRPHLFLRVNTRIWKLNYTNIYGMVYDYTRFMGLRYPRRHYYATQYLAMNVTKKLHVGLFQTIVFQRDTGYANGGFDPEYLNPIIFYKAVENGLNSPDKAIIGGDFKYNFMKHFSLYGQAVISELVLQEVIKRSGWFGNKYAGQLGLKYIDMFGVNNLDLQLEYNFARPYMYTSFNPRNAYVNYNQPMAHPLGANFTEQIAVVRYQPLNRLQLKAVGIYATYGNDTGITNWGRNIALNYNTRMKDYNNTIGQGIATQLLIGDFTASYMLFHNFFIDVQLTYRKTTSDVAAFQSDTFLLGAGIRWNMSERRLDY